MSDRRVTFQISTPAKKSSKGHRSREPGHDSGVGSSSSGQASLGGRPDRRFTAEDLDSQLYSVSALQEALGQANRKVDLLQRQCSDMDDDLTKAHKAARDTERLYRDECERTDRLNKLVKELEDQIITKDYQLKNLEQTVAAQDDRIKDLTDAFNEMRDDRDEYRHKYYNLPDPVVDTTMRGGSGEPSSRLHRSRSRHEQDHRESKGASRKHGEEKAGSSRHHRRRSSISINPGAGNKKPYIERMPGDPPRASARYSGNYTTTAIDVSPVSNTDPRYSAVPRISPTSTSGNYVPYPLHEPRGHRRS
ncbi:hypothetical protein F4820DRAFT_217380 [Hypoxylon rubiginosum]|uniref:Uncharacterized protein n=1 Tax=Hypoxylon rubiginosum TaxID=110542 RepID=A0ACB9ZH34_9PEZI|nr:hypothetical protein F4820DRAFT_217380 [Hypoxylon rubiginosum]